MRELFHGATTCARFWREQFCGIPARRLAVVTKMAGNIVGFLFRNGKTFNAELSAADMALLRGEHGNFYAPRVAGEMASVYNLDIGSAIVSEVNLERGGYPRMDVGVLYDYVFEFDTENASTSAAHNQSVSQSVAVTPPAAATQPAAGLNRMDSRLGGQIVSNPPTSSSQNETVSWSHPAVNLLLASFQEHREMFSSSACRKLDVWRRISNLMKAKGHNFSAEQCDKKWRSLRYRYNQIVEGNSKSGSGRRKWEWFAQMDEIMAGDPAVQPHVVLSSIDGVQEKESSQESQVLQQRSVSETGASPSTPSTPRSRKRKYCDEPPKWLAAFQQQFQQERNTLLRELIQAIKKD